MKKHIPTETMYREYKAIPEIAAQRKQLAINFRATRKVDPAKARMIWRALKDKQKGKL